MGRLFNPDMMEFLFLPWVDGDISTFVESHYAEPQRHYHTIAHINAMLKKSLTLGYDQPLRKLNMFPTFSAAIVFHDIVYDPTAPKGQNETESAVLARLRLADIEMPGLDLDLVCKMIEATIDHQSDDPFTQDFLDLDMSILSEVPKVYHAYARAIRREYSHVDLDTYVAGRTEFLGKQLDRSPLFFYEARNTARGDDYYSNVTAFGPRSRMMSTENAHRNIASEIGYLKRMPRRYLEAPTA